MKRYLYSTILLLTTCLARPQGVLVVDQQSTNLVEGAGDLSLDQPLGQSFTPSLPSVGFIRLFLYDGDVLHNSGATVFVNLRSDSIAGTILGSSLAIFMPDGYFDYTTFMFSGPVAITPGTTYYLQPVIQSGDDMGSGVTDGSYVGGMAISQGNPVSGRNLWFQEGIVAVPEPSSVVLALLGGMAWFFARHIRRSRPF